MASIATSVQRLATRQSSSPLCWSTIKILGTLRLFSSFQPLRIELGTDARVGIENGQAPDNMRAERKIALEGNPDYLIEKDWEFDDFSSQAHGELERHREARHYARITAYEMPRLSELVKPFVLPNEKQVLRFRYTTYMGEKHPAESKVVCEFATTDLPLTPAQREKLIKLAGVRYNPDTDIVRMSCEMFEHQAQNKRYLSDLVDTLMAELKSGDDFGDIPFDFRHHEAKKGPPKSKFPQEWRMNPKRHKLLREQRAEFEKSFRQ